MKVVVAGSRSGWAGSIQEAVDASGFEVTELVHGAAGGVDSQAALWARANGIPERSFPAAWGKWGRSAGPIRNREMAEYADALIALPGDIGTRNMVKQARERGMQVYLHGWRDE